MSQSGDDVAPLVISRGAASGTYQAFPDMCRLRNGSIAVVFYAGYAHVSTPKAPDWPNGGRICMVQSRDEGRMWSAPQVIYDDTEDNRDPHIALLPDGTLALTFFGRGVKIAYSRDDCRTWDKQAQIVVAPEEKWYCSAPIRVLSSGTWMLGVYKYNSPAEIYGGVLRSTDRGKTWSAPIPIGKEQDVPLDAETDVIALKDGTLYAALRCGKPGKDMYWSTSRDDGRTWSPVRPAGFHGEAPYLYRLKNGTILLGVRRRPDTVLYLSRDETRTWQGSFQIDNVLGGYPSIVERTDGTVLIVYYTEGPNSVIRVRRFRIEDKGILMLPL